jgi:hypothetical protein
VPDASAAAKNNDLDGNIDMTVSRVFVVQPETASSRPAVLKNETVLGAVFASVSGDQIRKGCRDRLASDFPFRFGCHDAPGFCAASTS